MIWLSGWGRNVHVSYASNSLFLRKCTYRVEISLDRLGLGTFDVGSVHGHPSGNGELGNLVFVSFGHFRVFADSLNRVAVPVAEILLFLVDCRFDFGVAMNLTAVKVEMCASVGSLMLVVEARDVSQLMSHPVECQYELCIT